MKRQIEKKGKNEEKSFYKNIIFYVACKIFNSQLQKI